MAAYSSICRWLSNDLRSHRSLPGPKQSRVEPSPLAQRCTASDPRTYNQDPDGNRSAKIHARGKTVRNRSQGTVPVSKNASRPIWLSESCLSPTTYTHLPPRRSGAAPSEVSAGATLISSVAVFAARFANAARWRTVSTSITGPRVGDPGSFEWEILRSRRSDEGHAFVSALSGDALALRSRYDPSSRLPTTRKSATSQVNGDFPRRSDWRRSRATPVGEVRRSSRRRSQDNVTGRSAVARFSISNLRSAPRRTINSAIDAGRLLALFFVSATSTDLIGGTSGTASAPAPLQNEDVLSTQSLPPHISACGTAVAPIDVRHG